MTTKKHTLDELEALLFQHRVDGTPAYIHSSPHEGIAWLVVNGKETGDYCHLCAFGGGAA